MSTPSLPVRALDLLASEWAKFRSVRSTFWSLLVAVVTPVAVSGLVAYAFAHSRTPGPAQGPPDPLLPEVLSLEYAVIAVSVLGVLAFSWRRPGRRPRCIRPRTCSPRAGPCWSCWPGRLPRWPWPRS